VNKRAAPHKRILIIDDDDGVTELFQEILGIQYDVSVFSNGLEFSRLMVEFHPDLVILDVMMPWVSGYDLCRTIKNNPAWKNTPVLFTSNRKRPEDIDFGLSRGADAYLTKPFSMQELRAKIKTLLKEPTDGALRPA
jgi:DNA-binding response OmpR family regulator